MRIYKYFIFFGIFFLFSCSSDEIYMESVNGLWKKKEMKKITFEVKDISQPKDILLVIRNNNDYPYSNIQLFSTFSLVGEKNKPDTLNYIMAKPNGEWLGSGFGQIKEMLLSYKKSYQFPKPGKYELVLFHAMRKDSLQGIEDIGVRIEPVKIENNKK